MDDKQRIADLRTQAATQLDVAAKEFHARMQERIRRYDAALALTRQRLQDAKNGHEISVALALDAVMSW